jgi:hypothetical protein
MQTLRNGSVTGSVMLCQRLLNKKGATPRLREDGIFGPRTHAAVLSFQARERIAQDGAVGPTTWSRLGLTIDITHPVQRFGQPTGTSCWSAAATIIVGNMSVGPGAAALDPGGGMLPGPENIRRFADSMGWRMHYPQTWSVSGLRFLLQRKPVWAVGGGAGFLHAIVLSAMWSDGAEDASGTMIRIHDPWPVNQGSIYARFYRGTTEGLTPYGAQFDFLTMYVLEPV